MNGPSTKARMLRLFVPLVIAVVLIENILFFLASAFYTGIGLPIEMSIVPGMSRKLRRGQQRAEVTAIGTSGVSVATIYRHFPSVHGLLVDALHAMIDPVPTPNTGSPGGSPSSETTRLFGSACDVAAKAQQDILKQYHLDGVAGVGSNKIIVIPLPRITQIFANL